MSKVSAEFSSREPGSRVISIKKFDYRAYSGVLYNITPLEPVSQQLASCVLRQPLNLFDLSTLRQVQRAII